MKESLRLRKLVIKVVVTYLVLITVFIAAVFLGAKFYRTTQTTAIIKIERSFEHITREVLKQGYIAIFLRNCINYICMSLPFIGIGHGILVLFNTGFETGMYLARRYTLLSPASITMLTTLLLILPHAVLELLSYSIAMESSIDFTLRILRLNTINKNTVLIYIAKLALGLVLLYLAAIFEYSTIMLSISKGNLNFNVPVNYR